MKTAPIGWSFTTYIFTFALQNTAWRGCRKACAVESRLSRIIASTSGHLSPIAQLVDGFDFILLQGSPFPRVEVAQANRADGDTQ